MGIFIAILVALTGGASFAAHNSLPGDTFYPVKTNLNEQVRGLVTLNSEDKAYWEATLADRRLAEAEELAVEGKLDTEVRAQIEANFKAHADRVQAEIKSLEDKDSGAAAEAAANLLTSLRAHERILLNISTSGSAKVKTEVESLNNTVKIEDQDTVEAQAQAETKLEASANVQSAAEGRMKSAQNKIDEVKSFIQSKESDLDDSSLTQVDVRVKVATDFMAQGKAKLEAKAYNDAFILFGKAHSAAQEAKLLLIAKMHLEAVVGSDDDASPSVSPRPSSSVSPSAGASARSETKVDSDAGAHSSGEVKINLGL